MAKYALNRRVDKSYTSDHRDKQVLIYTFFFGYSALSTGSAL